MSHYAVLVIGPNHVAQLAPYDENIEVAPYPTELSKYEESCIAEARAQLGPDATIDAIAAHLRVKLEDNYAVHEGVIVRLTRYNPKSKWDWYVVGGRWKGFFPLMNGSEADVTTKGAVDFERAQCEAVAEARSDFAPWAQIIAKHGAPKGWTEHFYPRLEAGENLEALREEYRAQPGIKAANERMRLWGDCPVARYGLDEASYIERQRTSALVPYAVVRDGVWNARGVMGWWGMSNDDMTREQWAREVWKLYAELPDDAQFTLVDCHI